MFLRRPYYKRSIWRTPSVSNRPLFPPNLLFQFYCVALSIDERVEIHDALVHREEQEWHNNRDAFDFEMRTYRYGRQMWSKDEQEAHQALDMYTSAPRGMFSFELFVSKLD